jgi:hypothetical protein
MTTILRAWSAALLLAGLLTTADAKVSDQDREDLRVVSQGYAQLYQMVSGLAHLDKAKYVKIESDKIEAMNEDIAATAGGLKDQLEELAERYPSLNLDDSGLPEIEKKKRRAIRWDRFADLAPIVGKTGKDYERTLLVTEIGLLNSVRFLLEVTSEEEKNPKRAALLTKARGRFDDLFDRAVRLLERDYFCAS